MAESSLESESFSEDALRAWLRLANLPFSSRLFIALLRHFDNDPEAIFEATDAALDEVPGVQSRHLVALRDPAFLPTDRQLLWLERYSVRLVRYTDAEYPTALLELPDPPALLFVRGSLTPEDRNAIGIVGSRQATSYGKSAAERMARELVEHRITVLSGGAVGIDSAAHRAALEAGGRTIAALGCGLDVDYPRANRELFERIVQQGALISEYPLGAQPEAWRFPLRNRIISGMTLGVLVVEAPMKSGALITARYAAEQGRPVMVIPGNIDRPTSAGSNDLLRDGAHPILEVQDILRAVGLMAIPARRGSQRAFDFDETEGKEEAGAPSPGLNAALLLTLPENQQKLLACLSLTPRHLDALAQETGLEVTIIGAELTLMELSGLAHRLPGNTYIRTI
jgi:DNA processing protein